MPGFIHGLRRCFEIVILGFILALIIRALLEGTGNHNLIILFDLLSILAILLLSTKIKYWSLSYLVGWLIGFVIFSIILTPWEIVLYLLVAIPLLLLKIKRKI